MRKYWFLVRDNYDISWLGEYVTNLAKGLVYHGFEVGYTCRAEVSDWSGKFHIGDVLIITDFDDCDLVDKVPDGVIKVSHSHGVGLTWIACNWKDEIGREKYFYDTMDIVTLNTQTQKRLIENGIDRTFCDLAVIGYPMDFEDIKQRGHLGLKKERKIIVAQRWEWDSQQMLCMEVLEPFINDPKTIVVIATPTDEEYINRTVGSDTVRKWKSKCKIMFRCTQDDFWKEASTARVFLTTGNQHTLNLSMIESYIHGCEIVAPDKYKDLPYHEFVKKGLWYKAYDIKDIRDKIEIGLDTGEKITEVDLDRFDYRVVAKNLIDAVERRCSND